MGQFYRIKEIAAAYGISTDTLRIYEEQGVFTPHHTDPKTKYRYYSIEQFAKLKYILVLKNLNFSLAEIKNMLSGNYATEQKYKELEQQYRQIKYLLDMFDGFHTHCAYEARQRTIEAHYVVCEDITAKTVADIVPAFDKISAAVAAGGMQYSLDEAYVIFRDSDFTLTDMACTPCVVVKNTDNPAARFMPAQKYIYVTHKEPYETLYKAYEFLYAHFKANNLKISGFPIERYIVGYANERIADFYITEVYFPFE